MSMEEKCNHEFTLIQQYTDEVTGKIVAVTLKFCFDKLEMDGKVRNLHFGSHGPGDKGHTANIPSRNEIKEAKLTLIYDPSNPDPFNSNVETASKVQTEA